MKKPKKKITTLCMVYQHPRVLLGMKKRGFGAGRWNGFGGKLEPGETLEENVVRELKEECGIIAKEIQKKAVMNFYFEHEPSEYIEVNVFGIYDFEGDPAESEEMRPKWFHIDDIPYSLMWPDDIHWHHLFFSGKKFKGNFFFKDYDTVIHHELGETYEV
jgi:8-oxo-dGTP diphosphatase / 2-hydroxy-dATP diphosphatase